MTCAPNCSNGTSQFVLVDDGLKRYSAAEKPEASIIALSNWIMRGRASARSGSDWLLYEGVGLDNATAQATLRGYARARRGRCY